MKKVTKIVAIALMAVAFVSCNKNKQVEEYDPQLFLQAYTLPLTRYSGGAGFDAGDVVGVYVVKQNAANDKGLSVNGNYVDNKKFINENDATLGYVLKPEAGKEVYLVEGNNYDIYSYFPYLNNVTTVTELPFSVKADQSALANFLGSDFLWAKAAGVKYKPSPVKVEYKHLFSQLIVSLVAGEGYTDENLNKLLTGVTVKNIVTDAKINIAEGKAVVGSQLNTVVPNKETAGVNMFRVIIPPQVVTDAKAIIDIEMGGKHYPVSLNLDFKSGRSYRMNINVDKDFAKTVITLNGVVSWETEDLPDQDITVENPSNIKKYCDITLTDGGGSAYLDGATIGTFECESGATTSYFDYAHNSGETVAVTDWMDVFVKIKNINLSVQTKYNIYVFVDWNNDGDFQDEKEVLEAQQALAGTENKVQTLPFTLEIPVGAVSPTTLRIIGGLDGEVNITNGCGSTHTGTVYDVAIEF